MRCGEALLLRMNKGKILVEKGGLDTKLEPEAVRCEDDVVDGEEGHAMFGRSRNSSSCCRVWRSVHEVGEDEGRSVHEVGEDEGRSVHEVGEDEVRRRCCA